MMKIVFIHYHLKRGGVTTVLRQQVEAIQERCDVLVLAGEPADSDFPIDTRIIPELGYTDGKIRLPDPENTACKVNDAIRSKWDRGCDLIHVHNPTLAKNARFLKILKAIQDRGIPLFLQIHDFAEDGRPEAYFEADYVSDCHYGTINSRDYHFLLDSGLNENGLHKIPNTIHPLDRVSPADTISPRILYPVRAIRRKNIGEAILLSSFLDGDRYISITLPPNSPKDIAIYEKWKNFVNALNLRVDFEAGLSHDFINLVAGSEFIITTSINEGFGFSFLEPWTAGKFIFGRSIPAVCTDFEDNGIRLDHLYRAFNIPMGWIGRDRFFEKWEDCMVKAAERFSFDIKALKPDRYQDSLTRDGVIDFGLLDEGFQKEVIRKVLSDKAAYGEIRSLNPFIDRMGDLSRMQDRIRTNRELVLKHYSRQTYQATLLSIYEKVVSVPVKQRIDKRRLFDAFLDPMTFSLLKWGNFVD